MYFLEKLKQGLAKKISQQLGVEVLVSDFEYPPQEVGGDLALPLFGLAKKLKKSPIELAKDLEKFFKKKKLDLIDKIETIGGYINFYLDKKNSAKEIIKELNNQTINNNYANIGRGEKISLEYVSPNSNKPLHLGHIRNGFLGESLANIMDFCGFKVERTALVNDRGVAICKSMLAYKLYGKGNTPAKSGLKSDHFVGKYYVLFEEKAKKKPKLLDDVQKMLQKWEKGDKPTWDLWKKMRGWAVSGYQQTYKRLGVGFDKIYYESELYNEGKRIVEEYLEKGMLERDKKGNVIAKLEKICNLPDKVLLREDGTAVYATTDLALAQKRLREGNKKNYYVVGSEQDLYFQQLFCILKMLNLGDGQKKLMTEPEFKHLSYGMVMLPEGKMKSREGTVVDADDLLDKLEALVKEEVRSRNDFIKENEADRRARIIALAALKFYILDVVPKTTIHFHPKESISFTGKTGPYLLYSYARLHSIWRKGRDKKDISSLRYDLIKENEVWALIMSIAKFPEVILKSAKELNPEDLASYAYNLALEISNFYHNVPVLEANLPERQIRIAVIEAVLDVLKKSLKLLGMEPLEEM